MAIQVYVVDDSAVVRQAIQHILSGDPDIQLVGSAPNPLLAAPAIRKARPDVLLVNPPRAGLQQETWTKLRQEALQNFTGPIVYSSCNASTMARDIGYLTAEGYRVRELKLFDFFPWTHHFETVALLTKT